MDCFITVYIAYNTQAATLFSEAKKMCLGYSFSIALKMGTYRLKARGRHTAKE
ncbi:MAG: hypothetical protein JST49_11785 [Bacteroidetes bacterium]|nr:hypothetical protein [Bacteroidota bacterium]